MKEVVKASKLLYICKDIAHTLEMYVKNNPNQEIEVEIDTTGCTNSIAINVIGQGHKMFRPINYRE